MSDPSLALQMLIRARLSGNAGVTALVPANSILDRNHRPEQFPSIIIGEGQSVLGDYIQDTYHDEAFVDVHIWCSEIGLTAAKAIAGAVKDVLRDGPWTVDGYYASNVRTVSARYMRDPDSNGQFSHTVLTVKGILIELPVSAAPVPQPAIAYIGAPIPVTVEPRPPAAIAPQPATVSIAAPVSVTVAAIPPAVT